MGKIAAILLLAALALFTAKLASDAVQFHAAQASATPPLMYAGIRG
jgi:hypothetical protein